VSSTGRNMTNNFIPALPRHALYCVWIMTGDSRRPLKCVWIDPEFRSFQLTNTQQTIATSATTTQRSRAKALYAERRSLVSIPVNELPQEAKGAIRPLSLVLGVVCLLLSTVVLVPFCFGQADQAGVHLTSGVVREPVASEVRAYSEEAEPLKANVDLVLVPVTVTDQKDRLVIGLEKDNFNVYEGFNRQVIRHISTEEAPISLGILFDTSSMYGKIERSREAVIQFFAPQIPTTNSSLSVLATARIC